MGATASPSAAHHRAERAGQGHPPSAGRVRGRACRWERATGLTNRRGLLAAIGDGPPDGTCALLLVDVAVLDLVRDAYGHAGGDAVLVELAGRLSREPGSVVARTDGDLLALLLPGLAADGTQRAIEHLRDAVEAPLLVERWSVHASATVGLAVRGVAAAGGPEAPEAPESVLRRARVALDEARRAGVPAMAWLPAHDLAARERLELVSELTDALGRDGELGVHLQTKHEPRSRRVVGLEALVRWEHRCAARSRRTGSWASPSRRGCSSRYDSSRSTGPSSPGCAWTPPTR